MGLSPTTVCPECGGYKWAYARRCRFCKWGKVGTHSHGYVMVRLPEGGAKVYEHRIVAEGMLGRELRPGEEVHHRNGDRADNRPENLEVLSRREHLHRHRLTVCKRGHDLTDAANVYIRPDTKQRMCRECCKLRRRWRTEAARA